MVLGCGSFTSRFQLKVGARPCVNAASSAALMISTLAISSIKAGNVTGTITSLKYA